MIVGLLLLKVWCKEPNCLLVDCHGREYVKDRIRSPRASFDREKKNTDEDVRYIKDLDF